MHTTLVFKTPASRQILYTDPDTPGTLVAAVKADSRTGLILDQVIPDENFVDNDLEESYQIAREIRSKQK
jgi:hypothetical protein